jgi:hypothetical protein
MMKKLIATLVILVFSTTMVFAQWQDNTNDQAQGQAQGQLQGQGQAQGQGQMQGQAAIAAQGQLQGQASFVDATNKQGQVANGSVSVEGDESDDKTYAASYPNLTGGEGVSQANAFSVFGGIGLSQTEKYKVYITQMQAVEASQSLTTEEKQALVDVLVKKMMDTNKKQRFCGIFWETSGRNLLNLFGILAWDSYWKEDQKPFQTQKKKK